MLSITDAKSIVFIVDDDVSVRESLELLVKDGSRRLSLPRRSFLRRLGPGLLFQVAWCWTFRCRD